MGLFLLYLGEDVRGALLRVSTAIPIRRMRGYRGQIFACPPLQAKIEGAGKNLRGARMKTINVVAAIIEKDGEILAHIESVDWLPADMKVVDALEKRGEL